MPLRVSQARMRVLLYALSTCHSIGTPAAADVHGVHEPFEVLRLVCLSGCHERPERDATAVGYKMKLRAKASAGSSQGVVDWLVLSFFFEAPAAERCARMLEPSTSNTLQSIRPYSSSDT